MREYRKKYDELIKRGNLPELLSGEWEKDKDLFIQMESYNDLIDVDIYLEDDDNIIVFDDDDY